MRKIKGKTLIIVAIVSILMLSVAGFVVWKKYFNNDDPLSPSPTMYTVAYYNEDGTKIGSVEVEKGKSSNFTFNPTKASDTYYDYTFEYWQDENGENVTSLLNNVNENMTVYPYFSSYQHTFVINFYGEDKTTLIESKLVARNSNVDIYNPTKASDTYYDYSFEYWSDNEGNDASSSMQNIQSNINLYAKFHISNQHTFLVNFYDDDGVTILQTYNVLKGNDLEVEDFVKEKDETYFYKFLNWGNAQGDIVDDITNIQSDMNLYAKYKYIQLNVISGGVTYSYNSTNDVYEVSDFDNSVSSVILLGEIEDIEVSRVLSSAFRDSTVLEEIIFSNNITEIVAGAFYNCTALKSINLTNNIEYIGANSFENCVSLGSINLPTKITVIKSLTFKNCSNLSYINIPDEVSRIELGAFADCISLSNVILPINLKTIGVEAFYNCTSLLNISFPDNLETIESNAFEECISLSSISFPGNINSYGENVFYGCTGLKTVVYEEGPSTELCDLSGAKQLTSITILNSATEIGTWNIPVSRTLETVVLPSTLQKINYNGFYGCSKLTNIELPSKLTSIGEGAFHDCTSLKNINLSNVTTIGDDAFYACTSLDNINLSNVTTIGKYAFQGCTSLESIELSEKLTTIGSGAFVRVKFDSITIPNGVKSYSNAFDTSTLKNIILADGTKKIPASAFEDLSALTSITIPDSVTSIGENAFKGTAIQSIRIPLGVANSFLYSLLNGMDNLETIIFPEQMYKIKENAFKEVEVLPNIIMPSTLEILEKYAFSGCQDITSLSFANVGPFGFNSTTGQLILPDSIHTLQDRVFCECSNLGGTISFPDSLKSIGRSSFSTCAIESLENLNNLESIGLYAFSTNKLISVNVPSPITVLPEGIFQKNELLESVTLQNELTEIGDYAFYQCTSLTTVEHNKITSIGDYAFLGTNLTSFDFTGVVTIGVCAFYDSSLKTINIGNTVTSIGLKAFMKCGALKYVFIPINVVEVGQEAFNRTVKKTIYCEATSKPSEWSSFWSGYNFNTGVSLNGASKPDVYWGATYDQYQEALNNQ